MADVERLLVPYFSSATGFSRQTVGSVAEQIVNGQPPESDQTTPPRHAYHYRAPDILTTRVGLRRGIYIKLFCNPSSGNWTLTKRGNFTKTAGGGVHNTWRNRHRGSYFDVFPLALEFQSGNIHPSAGHNVDLMDTERAILARNNPRLPPGLDNWYKFLALANSSSLDGNDPNYVILIYHSRVFPNLWIEGFFSDDSISFNEDAYANANMLKWSATLMVVRTAPPIHNYGLMRAMYIDYIRNTNAREASPLEIAAYNEDREWRNAREIFEQSLNKLDAKVARTEGQPSKYQKFKAGTTGTEISEQGVNVLA